MAEMKQVKRYLGAKFGYGEPIPDGVYAVPTETSKGSAFMRMEMKNSDPVGSKNFHLYWDEELAISWYDNEKPKDLKESDFAKAFRRIEKCR